jgi:hypothetical protein
MAPNHKKKAVIQLSPNLPARINLLLLYKFHITIAIGTHAMKR